MISDLKNYVKLCSQKDVISDAGDLRLVRKEILSTWANIVSKRGSMFNGPGMAIKDSRSVRTHVVYIRYRPELLISAYAWLYEARRISPPRWFKILSVAEHAENMYCFDCRLVERGDDLTRPTATGPAHDLPPGINL
jgi:hypothetical protein